jgi:MFS transporter, PAT family, beta-lactamase induction signal transducer AmpG
MQLGTINGTFGMIGFFVGSVLLSLCLCISVPSLGFVFLSQTLPSSVALVTAIITLAWFGYGIGAVGHMLYMMQQIAPRPYETARYSFTTGLAALHMMTAGVASGFSQRAVGYQSFFLIALASVAMPLLATWRAPFHHSETGEVEAAGGKAAQA